MSGGFLPAMEEVPKPAAPEAPAAEVVSESPTQADEQMRRSLEQEASKEAFLEKKEDQVVKPVETAPVAAEQVPVPQAVPQDPVTQEVAKILEEGLGDYFQTLPPDAQHKFQEKGQEVAGQIAKRVKGFRVAVKDILSLIYDWLRTIPSVNKFFLEQEAKIKTDRVLQFARERSQAANQPPAP
jgi:hypothetical protein